MAPAVPFPAPVAWSISHRILFRFVCSYFILHSFTAYDPRWHKICPWVGGHVFHLSGRAITYVPSGSGDTTLDYIQNLLYVVFAIVATLLWSLIDRKRSNYLKAESWLRLFVRYTLASALFGYGIVKVFPLQFRAPDFATLIHPYGEFSPMGVLWSFMGASTAYIIFAGAAEVIGAIFLLFRRTTALGSLIAFGVLLNVMVLNYCYDVPVKLYSTNLVLMSLYLASGDLRKLVNVFVLNQAIAPLEQASPNFVRRPARIVASVLWIAVVGFTLMSGTYRGWRRFQKAYTTLQRPPIYGLYDVDSFVRNGQQVPPLTTDVTRWRRLIVEHPDFVNVQVMNDSFLNGFQASYASGQHSITFSTSDGGAQYQFTYTQPDPGHLILEGTQRGDRLAIHLNRTDASKLLLVNRGFHWINEVPFNR